MIEKIILDYLADNGFAAYMELPTPIPDGEFLVIEKTGSSLTNYIYSAMIAIQSYADSMYEAAELNERVKTVMADAVALDDITKVDLNSDYNYTDTANKRYRYQAVFDITHY